MKRACSLLRDSTHYAAQSFVCGLSKLGYTMTHAVSDLGPGDILLTWNRHAGANDYANQAAAQGATVVVCENGFFGRSWLGDTWFALALDHHNGAGRWPRDDGSRWRAIGFELEPWRKGGDEIVILPQRSIGEPGIAMPVGWAERTQARIGGRIRPHPGRNAAEGLREDLEGAKCVIVWGSGGGVKALAWGIPVFYDFEDWIGAGAAIPLEDYDLVSKFPMRDDLAREQMFERLACAQWRQSEIESGHAFEELLKCA